MYRSIIYSIVLLFVVAAAPVSAKDDGHKCTGPSCEVCHPAEKKAAHKCTGSSCEVCHPVVKDGEHKCTGSSCEVCATKKCTLVTQTTCPVMDGNPINKNLFVDHNGERIYVCCNMCISEFKKDPAKYLKKIKGNGEKPVSLDDANLES